MHASQRCNHYVVQAAVSTLDFEAKSSLHPVHGKASQLTGFLDAVCENGVLALEPAPKMHVEFPIERLASGNALQDKEMWKLLDSRRNPLIRADLRELRAGDGTTYTASGEITMCGRARRYDGALTIGCGAGAITVDGSMILDIRHFGIAPPRFLMFTVQPEVNVRLHLVARPG